MAASYISPFSRRLYLPLNGRLVLPTLATLNDGASPLLNSETRPQRAVRFCAAEISVALFGERTLCRNEGKKKIIAAEKSS